MPDLRHPSVASSYLAACVTYATLFKTSTVELKYTAGLGPAIAKHLQTVAWETVQEYFKPYRYPSRPVNRLLGTSFVVEFDPVPALLL